MSMRMLTSGAALSLGLAMAAPGTGLAQSDAGFMPCINPEGKAWNDILHPRAYDPVQGFKKAQAADLQKLAARHALTAPDAAYCLIELEGARFLAAGTVREDGGVVVRKGDVLAGAEKFGVSIHSKPQSDTAEAAQQSGQEQTQTAQTDPENATPLVEGGSGNLAQALQQMAETKEVAQEDTQESAQIANEVIQTEAASGAENTGEVEVETSTVTEADARTSDQEFSTSANAQTVESDDGLSNFEKFALGALGAVAIGQVLDNGNTVVSNSGDRVVVQRQDGEYEVLKDDNALLRRPGTEVQTERYNDGSRRETLVRKNGVKIVTVKAPNGQVLRRTRILPDGTEVVLFDDTRQVDPVELSLLPDSGTRSIAVDSTNADELRAALAAQEASAVERRFSLRQIRNIRAVRELVPVIELDAINFDTASAAIRPSEAEELRDLGVAMQRLIADNPYEVFLVEGHTDAVGSATYNLALSDRRAESVALALTEYFDVPPENMVVQGYGESNLKIRTLDAERENRRATVRRITPLLQQAELR